MSLLLLRTLKSTPVHQRWPYIRLKEHATLFILFFVFYPNILSPLLYIDIKQSRLKQGKENSGRPAARKPWCTILSILPFWLWLGAFRPWSTDPRPASNQRHSERDTHGGITDVCLWSAQPEVDSTLCRPTMEQDGQNEDVAQWKTLAYTGWSLLAVKKCMSVLLVITYKAVDTY